MVAEKMLDERLLFEQLLSNLSAMFVNISLELIDQAINESLKQILDFFKVERCGLIQFLPGKKLVKEYLQHLNLVVERSALDTIDQLMAMLEDRQGLSLSRRRTGQL